MPLQYSGDKLQQNLDADCISLPFSHTATGTTMAVSSLKAMNDQVVVCKFLFSSSASELAIQFARISFLEKTKGKFV